jgi:hypothetical protein
MEFLFNRINSYHKQQQSRMVSSAMLRRVALVRSATRRNIPEDTILHSHRRENLKSYNKVMRENV